MDLILAIIGGLVGGGISGAIVANVVVKRTSKDATTTGDRSPTAQSESGPAMSAGGDQSGNTFIGRDSAGRDIVHGDVTHAGPPPLPRLVPFVTTGEHGAKHVHIRNAGTAVALGGAWRTEGRRDGLQVVRSGSSHLPERMEPDIEIEVAMAIYAFSNGPESRVSIVVEWTAEDGTPGSASLPL